MATVNSSLDGFAFVHLELHDAVGHVEHEVLQHFRVDILPALLLSWSTVLISDTLSQ